MKPYQQISIECEAACTDSFGNVCGCISHPYQHLKAPYGAIAHHLRESVLNSLIQAQAAKKHHPKWRIQIFDAYRSSSAIHGGYTC